MLQDISTSDTTKKKFINKSTDDPEVLRDILKYFTRSGEHHQQQNHQQHRQQQQ